MDGPQETKAFARRLRREMSLPEVVIWQHIRGRRLEGVYFRRQHPMGPYVLDFYCDAAKLAMEIDGEHHTRGERPEKDAARDVWFSERGIETLRIPAVDVLSDADGALLSILGAVRRRAGPQRR